MKRFNSKLKQDSQGEYVLYTDYLAEVGRLKDQLNHYQELAAQNSRKNESSVREINYWDGHKDQGYYESDADSLNETNYWDGHPNKGWS